VEVRASRLSPHPVLAPQGGRDITSPCQEGRRDSRDSDCDSALPLQDMVGIRDHDVEAAEMLCEPPPKPRSSPVNGLFQGWSRALEWLLRAKGMCAAIHERQLGLAVLSITVQSTCAIDCDRFIVAAMHGEIGDGQA
jgi:hypothetical protein